MSQSDATPTFAREQLFSARKLGWIAAIALATTIPSFLISGLTGEREDRATAAQQEIVHAWGPEQRVGGPSLIVPVTDKEGVTHYLAVAPRVLDVRATLKPSTRRRGLFATTVYEAAVAMTGVFDLPEGIRDGGPEKLKTGNALVVVDLSGTQGVHDDDHAEVAGAKAPWQSCADALPDDRSCHRDDGMLVADIDLSKVQGDAVPFNLTLHLRGTGGLRFAAAAKHATIRIDGAWPTPSFVGSDLPMATTTAPSGFDATWMLDRIGHPRYMKVGSLAGLGRGDATIGVDLIEGIPVYRTIMRVMKYGLLIVALTFATYFLFEVVTAVRVALFQYAMLGASLSLFGLLLLSVSEIAGYPAAYLISATLVTAQASLYTLSVTRKTRPSGLFAAMLATVFGVFYALVGLESYSLVVGAVVLFVTVSIIMGVTQAVSVDATPALGPKTDAVRDVAIVGKR